MEIWGDCAPSNFQRAKLLAVARSALWRALVFGWWQGRTEGSTDVFARLLELMAAPPTKLLRKPQSPSGLARRREAEVPFDTPDCAAQPEMFGPLILRRSCCDPNLYENPRSNKISAESPTALIREEA